MVQNLVLSGVRIAVLIPIAALGAVGLGAVVVVHELAEIVVIGNGLRARRDSNGSGYDHTAPAVAAEHEHANVLVSG